MGSKTRLLLTCAMSGLLLLIAITGVTAIVVLDRIHSGEAALRARSVERSGRLERIRHDIYLSSTLARDYFIEPARPDRAALRATLAHVITHTAAHSEHDPAQKPHAV